MNKKPTTSIDIGAVLAGSLARNRHLLFLYTSHANKYAIQKSFFAMAQKDETLLYITGEEPALTIGQFSVVHPENIDDIETISGKLRMIIDGISEHERLEEFLTRNKDSTALCMYDLSRLEPGKIQTLVGGHDCLILYTPDMTVLSAGFLGKLEVADKTIERLLKEYLDIVVLALINSKPMCGTDILDIIHRNFNVLLSPGTIYPLLHKLKEDGLLECECVIKKKVYKPARGREVHIRNILDGHFLANEFLSSFLKSTEMEAEEYEYR